METINNYANYIFALIFCKELKDVLPHGYVLYEEQIANNLYNNINRFNIPIRKSNKIYNIIDDFERRYPSNTIMIDLTKSFMKQEDIIKKDFDTVKNILKMFNWSIFVLFCWFLLVGC
jgi:hypothetical protein